MKELNKKELSKNSCLREKRFLSPRIPHVLASIRTANCLPAVLSAQGDNEETNALLYCALLSSRSDQTVQRSHHDAWIRKEQNSTKHHNKGDSPVSLESTSCQVHRSTFWLFWSFFIIFWRILLDVGFFFLLASIDLINLKGGYYVVAETNPRILTFIGRDAPVVRDRPWPPGYRRLKFISRDFYRLLFVLQFCMKQQKRKKQNNSSRMLLASLIEFIR